jgi:hypothetical protein
LEGVDALIGVAAKRPAETVASLKLLNELRARLAGEPMDLPMPEMGGRGGAKRKKRQSAAKLVSDERRCSTSRRRTSGRRQFPDRAARGAGRKRGIGAERSGYLPIAIFRLPGVFCARFRRLLRRRSDEMGLF